MFKDIEVCVEICREGIELPAYARLGDAGMDICAAEDVILEPGETKVIPTGIKVAIPEGYEIQVRPRSGISFKTPLRIPNSPGTIDAGFRDELGVIMTNTSELESKDNSIYFLDSKGNKKGTYHIRRGDRVAQIVLMEVPRIKFKVVSAVSNIGVDRGGGLGSTGIKK